MISLLAAALIVGDGYQPARDVAWLCRDRETAARIGRKADRVETSSEIKSIAVAAGCEPWTSGTLNVRDTKRISGHELGLIRLLIGDGPEVEYWVSANTLRWTEIRDPRLPPLTPRK